jgi:hypothetical protein
MKIFKFVAALALFCVAQALQAHSADLLVAHPNTSKGEIRLCDTGQTDPANGAPIYTAAGCFGGGGTSGVPLYVREAGSTGANYSANRPTLPNVGSAFANAGPFANYVLAVTIAANPQRNMVDCENDTGAQIAVVRDDGTAANGSAPANASVFAVAPGAGAGQQGGSYTSTTFRGRLQIYTPAALTGSAFVTCMED